MELSNLDKKSTPKQSTSTKKQFNLEESLHPSERDYSHITSSNQKYCASIFFRGWQLKSQTLYSQFKWFEQFESHVISKMDPSHIDESENFIDGSNGIINVGTEKISAKYPINGANIAYIKLFDILCIETTVAL